MADPMIVNSQMPRNGKGMGSGSGRPLPSTHLDRVIDHQHRDGTQMHDHKDGRNSTQDQDDGAQKVQVRHDKAPVSQMNGRKEERIKN